jgi:hypothetical protein
MPRGNAMASQLQKQIYQAYMNAGLSPNQARIITAEVGRENSFNPQTVFGVHSDPKNKALNLGMLSWQGDRGRSLYSYLHSKGLIQNGSILKSQAALDEMARFSVSEMKNNKGYAQTAKTFLSNPNVDYQTGAEVLGKNYIRWRYDDPNYSSGHANRDHFYRAMGGVQQPTQDRLPTQKWSELTGGGERLPTQKWTALTGGSDRIPTQKWSELTNETTTRLPTQKWSDLVGQESTG